MRLVLTVKQIWVSKRKPQKFDLVRVLEFATLVQFDYNTITNYRIQISYFFSEAININLLEA
jgi:hypothetical protein